MESLKTTKVGKIRELRTNPRSEINIMGLNGFIQKAIQIHARLSEPEKRNIGAFIPMEAIQYLNFRIPENLILDASVNKYLKYKTKYLELKK